MVSNSNSDDGDDGFRGQQGGKTTGLGEGVGRGGDGVGGGRVEGVGKGVRV
jgi:hypothetical protein